MYSCRRKIKNAKRDSSGIMVFIKKRLSKNIEIVENNVEDILWLKANCQNGQNTVDIYFCCTYILPKSSCRYQLEDVSKLDILQNNVIEFKNKGHVIILGDINCRTGTEDDFIDVPQVNNFVPAPGDEDLHIDDVISVNNYVNKHRRSEDNVVNEYGGDLLKMCNTDNIFIVNGRIGNDPECKLTCHTSRGQSVVDYFIVNGTLLKNIKMFAVSELTPLSDHCSVSIQLNLDRDLCPKNRDNKCTTRSYYKWKDEDKNRYIEVIN